MKRLLILAAFFASFGVAQSLPYFYCADAGSTDDYACNLTPYTPAAYVTGGFYSFKANTANTGAATINFNSLGAKTIVKVAGGITTALATNDILVGQYIVVQYDGTNMQMQSTLGNAATSLSPAGSATTDAQCWASSSTLGVCTAPIFTQSIAANTSADGIILANSSAATSGNQRYSPRVRLSGFGIDTNGNTSKSVNVVMEAQPIAGFNNPSVSVPLMVSVNGGTYYGLRFDLNGTGSGGVIRASGANFGNGLSITDFALNFAQNGANLFQFISTRSSLSSGSSFGFSTNPGSTSSDIAIDRDAAGILGVIDGTQGTTAANYRALKLSALYHAGTTYTLSTNTCSGTTLVGGATGGTFVSGTTGSCTGVVTMGNSATAPTGWKCNFGNRTSAVAASETASTTTTATFAIATVSGEVVAFTCDGF